MQKRQYEVIIVGAGVVGSSIAMHLAKRKKRVLVLEKEHAVGLSVSARSSGVVHSGVYFPAEFLKTKLCVEGQPLVYEWAAQKKVPGLKVGKLIVAYSEDEAKLLEKTFQQAKSNQCRGIEMLGQSQVSSKFPYLNNPVSAMFCRETGIVNPLKLNESYWHEATAFGAEFQFSSLIKEIQIKSDFHFSVQTAVGVFESEILINSAALNTSHVAALVDTGSHKKFLPKGMVLPRVYHCRGDYFSMKLPFEVPHLIYPAKDPLRPGLGIHLTLDFAGNTRMGPDTTYLENESVELEPKKKLFQEAVSRMFKVSGPIDMQHAGFGVRPKLTVRGEAEKDFYIQQDFPGWWNLVGIESPGVTASYRIGQYVSDKIFS